MHLNFHSFLQHPGGVCLERDLKWEILLGN